MNLYLRLLVALLRAIRLPAIEPGAWVERRLRVWPGDLDVNGHMNNGRYLTIIDLLLVEYFIRTGFARVMLAAGWRPMSGGAFITYRRSLKPLQSYRVRLSLVGADAVWSYLRFEYLNEDGVLVAAGYMKGAVVGRAGLVANADIYAHMGQEFRPGSLPEPVSQWLAAEASLMRQ